MKKTSISLIFAVVLVALLSFAACGSDASESSQSEPSIYAENIATIDVTQMDADGTQVTNYTPILSDKIDWVGTDDETIQITIDGTLAGEAIPLQE